ncbi:MAG TPA: hypothetical protein VFR95_04835 [Gemmatimonadaceae bacterium]|nr:hypothetical protein [Gemmatimonadaceae bacterium]
MPGPRCPILALFVLGALAGCKSSSEPTAAGDSLFVNTMADLRRIKTDPALDSAGRDSAREATLRSHGVTVDELVEMARELSQDPGRALDDWREIERLAAQGDTTRAPAAKPKGETPQYREERGAAESGDAALVCMTNGVVIAS